MEGKMMIDHNLLTILELILTHENLNLYPFNDDHLQGQFYIKRESAKEAPQYLFVQGITSEQVRQPKLCLETQASIYKSLKAHLNNAPDFTKNASYLLCINKTEVMATPEEIETFTLFLEEDAYYFKKFVLTYTSDAAAQLLDELNDAGIDNYINSVISSPEKFQDYIDNNSDLAYSLMIQLLIKLPFVPLNFTNSNDVDSLADMLNDQVAELNLTNFRHKLATVNKDQVVDSIGNITKQISSDLSEGLAMLETFFTEWGNLDKEEPK